MPVERFYTPHSLEKNEKIELKEGEFHHLAHVIRSRIGEQIEIVNGKGILANAIIQEIKKDRAILFIEQLDEEPFKESKIILAQAIPKTNRLEFILEKGTELGVDEFWLFPGELSPKKELFPNQIERMESILISAIKQCGRLWLPKIVLCPILENWKQCSGTLYFGDLDAKAPLLIKELENTNEIQDPIVFFTGPESGFTDNEVNVLRNLGTKGVKLHSNVLRTDTASITALAIISHYQAIHEIA
ncbi:MAG: 16S rRNA (uracil(1498)-N(3))-methyltransferase [Parachlamydiaceae bacterium]|nr:16S rRNA (uracil(1498)-N(3))-methyltransferase [Parachlamydiaceae bacterium]